MDWLLKKHTLDNSVGCFYCFVDFLSFLAMEFLELDCFLIQDKIIRSSSEVCLEQVLLLDISGGNYGRKRSRAAFQPLAKFM